MPTSTEGESKMFEKYLRRPITKEQYDLAIGEYHGYLAPQDMEDIFSYGEIHGYGVYGTTVHKDDYDGYYVSFWLGNTCD